MTRSKIFLATTASLLGVVGFISAKAHRHFNSLSFYTKTSSTHSPKVCTRFVTGAGTTTEETAIVLGYTKYDANGCDGKTVYAE